MKSTPQLNILDIVFYINILLLSITSTVCSGYVITTPRRWTVGEASQVCITVASPAATAETISLELKGQEAKNGTRKIFVSKMDLVLPQDELSICHEVDLPDTDELGGLLTIEGSLEGKTLNYTKPITIATEVSQTFVQTDKFLYKPSQLVQFRILTVVGPYLKVAYSQYEEIWIESPSGTRLTQWLNVPNDNGLIHLSFRLSEEPEEGSYEINVRAPSKTIYKRNFKVEEYVLPRYEVKIKPPSYVLGTAKEITFKVCAKYTFGEPVKGNVTISVDNNDWGTFKLVVKKEDKISGCKKFIFNSTELSPKEDEYFPSVLKANAVVTEEGTGVELKAEEASVNISRTAIKFEDISVQNYFKPELPFVGEVKVTFPDESVVANELLKVCCKNVCKNLTTNANGILKFAVPPHIDGTIRITAPNYPHIKSNNNWRIIMYEANFYKNIKKYHSDSNSSLVIALPDDEFECSATTESISFEMPIRFASLKQESASVTVQIISRGQIQFSKTFVQSLAAGTSLYIDDSLFLEPMKEPNTKELIRGHFTVPIVLPKTVSPKAKVIVWYARDDGEVLSDARDLSIMECLLNNVNLTWSTEKAQPGDPASVTISAAPLSLCSLGVVDKSVELLSAKINALTIKTLLELADKASVTQDEHLQVDDQTYCQEKYDKDPSTALSGRDFRFAEPELVREEPLPLIQPVPIAVAREKRWSFIGPWDFYSDDVDSLHMFDEAGIYVLSDLKLENRPCRRRQGPIYLRSGGNEVYYDSPVIYEKVANDVRRYKTVRKPSGDASTKARTYFPETWIWNLVGITEDGVTVEALTLPDTVTEWVGSAVCVHPTKGVGISPTASITTFKEFFADLTLPPSVKRGETFPVKISVFNYLKESLPLKVILDESPEYDILDDVTDELGSGERSSCLAAEDKTVHFVRIRPKAVGDVNITIRASVDVNSITDCGTGSAQHRTDVLVKPIKVLIEGFFKEDTQSKYVCTKDLAAAEDALETWTIKAPALIIPDSARGFVAVVGDLIGPTLENLGDLVKMPYGCGEQNMLNFAPNIFVMQYLDASKQNNENTASKAIEFMEKGYQRELNYRHRDGSFSAFGESDGSGSTWLTAFVLKSFALARAYVSIDQQDLNMSRDWLKKKQLENGCFESVGRVLHKGMKGGLAGSSSPSLLSAFVLIALIEAGESDTSTAVREAIFCLNADEPTKNPYSLAVKSYALALAGSPETQANIDQLLGLAVNKTSQLYWELPNTFESSKGVGLETASYAILALLAHGTKNSVDYSGNVRKIVKWINNQRNGQGGFISTQDTIVALQALAEFEKTTPEGPVDLTVLVGMDNVDHSFTVNEKNKFLQQVVVIPTVPTTATFDIVGEGCVLLQAILRYNVPDPEANEAFSLKVETATEPDKACKTKRITACAAYKLPDKKSNMAIIEVNLVSGYIPEKADLKRIIGYGTGLFKRYEVDGSTVTIYIDEFSPEEICVSFRITREVDVEDPKPGNVKVYDYYKPEYHVSEKFTLPPITQCVDEGEEFSAVEGEIVSAVDEGAAAPAATTESLGAALEAFDAAII